MVYIPVRNDIDMQQNHCSFTLGQLQLKNDGSRSTSSV